MWPASNNLTWHGADDFGMLESRAEDEVGIAGVSSSVA
jgi:hypothetical protein